MKLILAKNDRDLGEKAAEIVLETLAANPAAVLGLATGSSPVSTYYSLICAYRANRVSFAGVRTLNLDEYVGLSPDNGQSYHYYMKKYLFDSVDLAPENTHIPNGNGDPTRACREYDALLDRFPIDLQLLGLGANGHLGFNEPGTPRTLRTHLVNLTEKTRQDNARFFQSISDVPKQAITMGLYDILRAKRILILVSGERKAAAVARMIREDPSENCPATLLKTHPAVTLVADRAALSALTDDELEKL